jgi:hypothetical protein
MELFEARPDASGSTCSNLTGKAEVAEDRIVEPREA